MALLYLYEYIRNVSKTETETVYFYAPSREDADEQYLEKYGIEEKQFVDRGPW